MEQIENLRIVLGLKNMIGFTRNERSEAYRLSFGDVQMYDWLLSIGLTPNKSLTIGPIEIPDKYFIDFLRGHLDGDGSITTFTDRYNTRKNPKYVYERIYLRFISASKAHIDWLHSKIVEICGVHGAVHMTKISRAGKNPMHIIKFGKKESLQLLSQIYYSKDIPCLSRKRSVYETFLGHLCPQ